MIREDVAKKEQEIRELEASLSSAASDIGDWKIAKSMEYQAMGLEPPYNMEELHRKRQAVRDRINELQEEVSQMQEEYQEITGEEFQWEQ